jgi:hypothetical protein
MTDTDASDTGDRLVDPPRDPSGSEHIYVFGPTTQLLNCILSGIEAEASFLGRLYGFIRSEWKRYDVDFG